MYMYMYVIKNNINCGHYFFLFQYSISEHGEVKGEQHMMAEIYARGPIGCGVAVTKAFLEYSGGIFNDNTNATVR